MMKFWMKAVSWIMSFVFSIVLSNAETHQKDNYYEPVGVQSFVLFDGLMRCQGITTDGSHYYFSMNYGLTKTEMDATTVVKQNLIAIPSELLKLGCKHIGGISYADGKIFVTIEDSKVFKHLYLAVFDAETLELIKYKALPTEYHENGAPWCVADAENGTIYSARRDHIEELVVYDMDTLEFVKTIKLDGTAHKIQGGEMYQGILYLSASREMQSVFAIKVSTGEVQRVLDRNLVDGTEGEDMTILPTADGALFHILDIGSVRVGTHLRHYAFDVHSIKWKA